MDDRHLLRDRDNGHWPARRSAILSWLVTETRNERFIDNIFVEMCRRLLDIGVPLARATMNLDTHNPQWLGASILWEKGMREAKITTFDYGIEQSEGYLNSPIYDLENGLDEVRGRLDGTGGPTREYPVYTDFRERGYTDYIARPLDHTLDRRHTVTFASDGKAGFSDDDVSLLRDLIPALALVSEIRVKNRLARTLLETYVGPHASEQILAGATTRGSGVTLGAAIMICDLRDFTAISDMWPRDDVIDMLNGYFDALSEPIDAHGGEILKFMGDGLLAIFPLTTPTACLDLLRAIGDAQAALAVLNEQNRDRGRPILGYGTGVHVGDVMYGNVGSKKRLDFTAIGPAVNIASRLETLTKTVKRPVLLSGAFVSQVEGAVPLDALGSFQLRGLGQPIDVFAPIGDIRILESRPEG